MKSRLNIEVEARRLVNQGNGVRATALAKAANMAWHRGIKEIEAPSLFDFQFEEIDGDETDKTVRHGFQQVKLLIERAFTRCGLTVLCVSGSHERDANAVTIRSTGFTRNDGSYDRLNLCFLFWNHGMQKLNDLQSRQITPRTI